MRGDRDWIVGKCLEKDRRRRYQTADALAADLTIDLNTLAPFALDWNAKQVTAEIVNMGKTPAGEFLVALGLSHPSSLAATRPQSPASVTLPGFPPGQKHRLVVPIEACKRRSVDPTKLKSALLEIWIDPKNAVRESNENNNKFSHVY